MEADRDFDELRVLQRTAMFHRWRWRAEEKRLRRQGIVDPWRLHFGELRSFRRLWREMRREAGLRHHRRKPPPIARRACDEIDARKYRSLRAGLGE